MLLPAEPFSTRLLYYTYATCASIKNTCIYRSALYCGVTLSIVIGTVEYIAEKALQKLRKPFLREEFNYIEWKSECRIRQIESAIQTLGEFVYAEIDPTLCKSYAYLLQDKHYYLSTTTSPQWVVMNEYSPLIIKMGEELRQRMKSGMHRITQVYAKDIALEIDEKNHYAKIFLNQLRAHSDLMAKFTGSTSVICS